MATSPEREHVIRTAWKERGADQWDREFHGRGLVSLNIPASTKKQKLKPGHEPLPRHDNLEFRLERRTIGRRPVTAIVCEGVAVEWWPVKSG